MGESLRKKVKFWMLFLLGVSIYAPFLLFSLMIRHIMNIILFTACFLFYNYGIYHFVWKKVQPKYPMVPPEGRVDVYFPRTNIPRPIHEDVRRYPVFFKKKVKKKYERTKKIKKKR